jgi:guanine deaminase
MNEQAMQLAIEQARTTMSLNVGGPFGAAIISQSGEIIAVSSNSVLGDHDATAHAEVNVIRKAGKILNTHDLTGYTLVTTCYPCPMCLSAIIWANIKDVYYACTSKDAKKIGFRDDFIYDILNDKKLGKSTLNLKQVDKTQAILLFEEYASNNKTIY